MKMINFLYVFFGLMMLDVSTTEIGLYLKKMHEGNLFMVSIVQNVWIFLALKVIATAIIFYLVLNVNTQSEKAGRFAQYLLIGMTAFVVINNIVIITVI